MEITVYTVVNVTFDYYRFERFVGVYYDYNDVLEVCKDEKIFKSVKPLGLTENDGMPSHMWVIPQTLVLEDI